MRQARLVGMVLLVTAMGLQFLGNAGRASAQATGRDDIPPELRPWQGWALAGAEFLRCPYISGLDATQPASRICHWIGALRIDAGVAGAAFHEEVRVFAPGWVTLPGDSQRWPQNVRLDGAAVPVVRPQWPSSRVDCSGGGVRHHRYRALVATAGRTCSAVQRGHRRPDARRKARARPGVPQWSYPPWGTGRATGRSK